MYAGVGEVQEGEWKKEEGCGNAKRRLSFSDHTPGRNLFVTRLLFRLIREYPCVHFRSVPSDGMSSVTLHLIFSFPSSRKLSLKTDGLRHLLSKEVVPRALRVRFVSQDIPAPRVSWGSCGLEFELPGQTEKMISAKPSPTNSAVTFRTQSLKLYLKEKQLNQSECRIVDHSRLMLERGTNTLFSLESLSLLVVTCMRLTARRSLWRCCQCWASITW